MRFRRQFWASAVILIVAIFYLMQLSHGEAVPIRKSLKDFPLEIGNWKGKEEGLDSKVKAILGVEDSMMRVYRNDKGYPIWFYVGYYESQSKGNIIHSPKHCYPGSGWHPTQNRIEEITISSLSKEKIRVNLFLIRKGVEKQLVLYWYQERGRINTSEYMAKFYMIVDAITRNRTDGALVRISAPVINSVDETLKQEKEFIRLAFPFLKDFLPE